MLIEESRFSKMCLHTEWKTNKCGGWKDPKSKEQTKIELYVLCVVNRHNHPERVEV